MASGNTSLLVRITLLSVLQYAVLLATGAAFGLAQLGWAIVLAAVVTLTLWLSMSPVVQQVPKWCFARMLLKSGCVAAPVMGASTAALVWSTAGASGNGIHLVIGVTAAMLAFLAAAFVFKHPLREEFAQLHSVLGKRQVETRHGR
ncbi:MAG: hypothetical protein KGM49_13390, partial [Sphingomonadales bacterium]|nr:hypothetical protein [Sphingomonadales bacterium]